MDLKSLKAMYRKKMVEKIIRRLEKNNALPDVSTLKAMQVLVSAWNPASAKTIVNCFRRAEISTANQEGAITDKDDPFKDLQNEIDALRNLQPYQVPEDVNATLLTNVEAEVSAVQPPLTDFEILGEFFENGNISDGGDEVMDVSDGLEEEPMECPRKSDPLLKLEVLQKFSLFSTNAEAVQADCLKIEQNIYKHFTKNKKQTTIKDFFK